MTTEFFGSFLVFGFALLFAHSKYRPAMYGLLFIVTFNTWLIAFIAGMLLADLYSQEIIKQKKRSIGMIALPLLGLFLGGFPVGHTKGTLYGFMVPSSFSAINFLVLYTILGSCLVVYSVISTQQIARLLSHKKISILGRYTFSLYLTHIPVLFTFTTGMFLYLNTFMGYNKSVLLSLIVSIPVVATMAWLFERYVDSSSIRFANYLANIYHGKQELNVREELLYYKEKTKLMAGSAYGRITSAFSSDKEPLE